MVINLELKVVVMVGGIRWWLIWRSLINDVKEEKNIMEDKIDDRVLNESNISDK
jgi:hypothetical protein